MEEDYQKKIDELFQRMLKIISLNNGIFSRRKYYSLVHGDSSRSNIFFDKNQVKLVDWELACYHHREKDLAFFVWSYELDERKKQLFLRHAGYPLTDFSRKQFETMYLVHCINLLTWGVERLKMVQEGMIDRNQKSSTLVEIMDGIRENIQLIEKALKNPFL